MLSERQIEVFSRQILLREVGGVGQERLLAACVEIPRLTPGGRACALWLARAGVGRLTLPVDESPSPEIDPAGLLLAEDAGRPLADTVRTRLQRHAPELIFDGVPSMVARAPLGATEGALAAIEVVRRIIQGEG